MADSYWLWMSFLPSQGSKNRFIQVLVAWMLAVLPKPTPGSRVPHLYEVEGLSAPATERLKGRHMRPLSVNSRVQPVYRFWGEE